MIINGRLEEPKDQIPESWLLGDGVFESFRTYGNRPFALDLHLARLALGVAQIRGVEPDLSVLRGSVYELLESEPKESGRVRIIYGADGNWMLTHEDYSPPENPARCTLIEVPATRLQVAKGTSYGFRFGLRRDAEAAGYQDAILKDQDNWISEATTSNLIALIGNKWVTPSLVSGGLAGITRQLLMENFGICEAKVSEGELLGSEAVALISSLREIHPVQEIDGKVFAFSKELETLKSAFSAWILGNL